MRTEMQIEKFEVRNFKGITLAQGRFAGNVVSISGDNGSGKSSLIDALCFAIGGLSVSEGELIKTGTDEAVVIAYTNTGLKITRTVKAGRRQSLKIEQDGKKKDTPGETPQKFLDRLMGDLSYDPLEFANMKAGDRKEELLKVIGVDLKPLEEEHDELYIERKLINKRSKEEQAVYGRLPVPDEGLLIDKVSVSGLGKEFSKKTAENQEKAKAREVVGELDKEANKESINIIRIKEEITQLENEMYKSKTSLASINEGIGEAKAKFERMSHHDLSIIEAQIFQTEESNRSIEKAWDRRKAKDDSHQRIKSLGRESEAKTDRMKEIEQEKTKAIESANLPVKGLGFDSKDVTMDGRPLANECSSRIINLSALIGIKSHPNPDGLKMMFIREGDKLDSKRWEILERIASQHGWRIVVESINPHGDAVMIEDGISVAKKGKETSII